MSTVQRKNVVEGIQKISSSARETKGGMPWRALLLSIDTSLRLLRKKSRFPEKVSGINTYEEAGF